MKNKVLFGFLLVLIIVNVFSFVSAEKGTGSAVVPITNIDLSEQGNDYSIKPGRLKFEFDEKLYAIQVRRVKQEYTEFLIMTLDMDKLGDITAYNIDNSFSLNTNEKKEIDLNGDGINDVLIELNEIKQNLGSINSADFSIKRINTLSIASNEMMAGSIEELISESVLVLEQKKLTFFEKVINWVEGLFG